jgi:hypothetical protein
MIVEDEKDDDTIHINLNQIRGTISILPPEVNVSGLLFSLLEKIVLVE